jgi:3',5'-cyclic AMP phosphodiesterase CpdA
VAARVLHVSDLHIKREEPLEPLEAVRDLVSRLEPELLLATGDLAHRGRPAQLERAAELLHSLGVPLLVVPGNHDIPYAIPARFTRAFAEWHRIFGTTEPVFTSDDLFVVGLNSVRPWRQQGGALSDDRLTRATSRLGEAPARTLRVVALHHHLAAPPWRAGGKRPLAQRDRVLGSLAAAGADLVVSGHVHQAAVAERREFEALEGGGEKSVVLANAPGFARPRPKRRGEARGVNVYEAGEDTLSVTTYTWDGSAFAEVGRRSFRRQ